MWLGSCIPAEAGLSHPFTSLYRRLSGTKDTIITLLTLKGFDLFFGAKSREDLRRRDTIHISEQRVVKWCIRGFKYETTVTILSFLKQCICLDTSTSTLIPHATEAHTKNTPPQHSKTCNKKVRLIFASVLKRIRFIFRSQKDTIYTSYQNPPKATIIRHDAIIRLLLVDIWFVLVGGL